MHNVVFQTIGGTHDGVVTWSVFRSKEHFDQWYDEKLKSWYRVVAEGVTPEEAVKHCSTPAAKLTALGASIKEAAEDFAEGLKSLL